MSDEKKIIFSMVGVSKSFNNNNKQVLKDIHLSFFYGAKIGVIGLNGSGKSTLLKIIAGLERSYQGDIHFKEGHSIGYLEQEPKLDEAKTVIDIVKEGAKEQVDVLEEYNILYEELKKYKKELLDKPRLLFLSKVDIADSNNIKKIKLPKEKTLKISSVTKIGLDEAKKKIFKTMDSIV